MHVLYCTVLNTVNFCQGLVRLSLFVRIITIWYRISMIYKYTCTMCTVWKTQHCTVYFLVLLHYHWYCMVQYGISVLQRNFWFEMEFLFEMKFSFHFISHPKTTFKFEPKKWICDNIPQSPNRICFLAQNYCKKSCTVLYSTVCYQCWFSTTLIFIIHYSLSPTVGDTCQLYSTPT